MAKYWTGAVVAVAFSAAGMARAEVLSVCERTASVKEFIEQDQGKPCAEITEADLAAIVRVAVPDSDITEFKVGDFSGLPNLEILNVKGNPFTSLPIGVFSGLPKLKTLVIFDTQLASLPYDFLDGMDQLQDLHIFSNPFTEIPWSVWTRLARFEHLVNLDFNDALAESEKHHLQDLFPAGGQAFLNFY
jgi:hypothetical protein